MSRWALSNLAGALAVCVQVAFASHAFAGPHDALIAKHAAANGVPQQLVHRVIRIESRGNAAAVHAGNYGLMQIRLATARGVGYSGDAKGLLDPDTNLTYAVRYLAGAYRAAGCDANRAVSYYQRGYYGAPQRDCNKPAFVAVKPDVIKPRVVRTETIAPSKAAAVSAATSGNFQSSAITPPLTPQTVGKADMLTPTAGPAVKLALASVPLPPARPELGVTSKQDAQPAHHAPERAGKKSKTEAKLGSPAESKTESKFDWRAKTDDPIGVVSFLKKLVTPDTKPRKQPAVEAEAEPPSQTQPPQY